MFTHRTRLRFVLLAFVPAVLCLFLFQGRAAGEKCSNATLKGTFGVLERGTMFIQLFEDVTPPMAFSNVALATYDGQGNFSGTYTASDNGVVVSDTFSGTYTVNPDCTMTDDFTIQPFGAPAHHAGAIVRHGAQMEVDFIYNDPWIAASGIAKRTPAEGCSARTLMGRYVEALEGALINPKPTPAIVMPAVETGVTTFDGAGHFAGTFTSTIVSGSGEGTYTVNADCTFSMLGTSGDGAGSTNVGVITGEGPFQELQTMFTVDYLVASGPMKKQQ